MGKNKIASAETTPEDIEISAEKNIHHEREKVLAEKPLIPLILTFSIPTILAMLVNALYVVVDRIWIGRMPGGSIAMAGVGLSLPITTIAFSFMALIGIGSTALLSIRLGEKRYGQAEMVLGNCLTASAIIGAVISVVGMVFAERLLSFFGADAETMPHALSYVRIILMFNIINSIQFAMSSTMRGVGHPTWAVITQIVGAVTNMVLDPIFVLDRYTFRLFGAEWTMNFGMGLGVKGAAIATGIAQCVSLLIVVIYFVSKTSPVPLLLKAMRPKWSILRRASSIGMSAFAVNCVGSFAQMAASRQLSILGGNMSISAITLIYSVAMFAIMPIIGVAQGVQPIIGYNYGAGNFRRVRSAFFGAVAVASIIAIMGAIIIQTQPSKIASFFSDDPELVRIASKSMKVMLLALPVLGFQIMSGHYYQYIGRSFVSLIITLLRQAILLIPLYFILPHFLGLNGIFIASPVSDFLTLMISLTVMTFELRRISRKIKSADHAALAKATASRDF
jgi:putative MATE family efflux protein